MNSQEHSLGQLSWKLSPLSLISRCAHVTTKLPMQQFEGEICAGSGGAVEIHDADVSVPASVLQSKIPVPVQGQLSSHIDELQLQGNVLQKLKGNFTWNNARVSAGANWVDIGSYAAELSDNGNNGINAKLFQLSGPLEVNLQIELLAPAGGRMTGQLFAPQTFIESARAEDVLAMFAQLERVDDQNIHHYRVDMNL